MRPVDERAYEEFVRLRYVSLLRSAMVLTSDRHSAEDLAQTVLVTAYVQWNRVASAAQPMAFLHKLMVDAYLSGRRRRRRSDAAAFAVPIAETPDGQDTVEERDELRRILAGIPPRQRAAVVLRYYERYSEKETAAMLGCSVANVQSLTTRGLFNLRSHRADISDRAISAPDVADVTDRTATDLREAAHDCRP